MDLEDRYWTRLGPLTAHHRAETVGFWALFGHRAMSDLRPLSGAKAEVTELLLFATSHRD